MRKRKKLRGVRKGGGDGRAEKRSRMKDGQDFMSRWRIICYVTALPCCESISTLLDELLFGSIAF